jgi:hypothetical protein
MNRLWHDKNKMSKNPSLKERIAWHVEHAEFWGCRPIPASLFPKIAKTKLRKK